MDIHTAIMKAADQIEQNPNTFDFDSFAPSCNSPGCALGWIAYFTNHIKGRMWAHSSLSHALGFGGKHPDALFYDRLDRLCGNQKWRDDAALCAQTLRAYARKYHAPEKPKGIPAAVREIFEAEVA